VDKTWIEFFDLWKNNDGTIRHYELYFHIGLKYW